MYIIALWCRFDAECSEKHQLFFKEHSVRNQAPEHSKGQTLFVLNIPPYATTDSLKHAFTDLCGNVRSVTFSSNKGFKSAYIVFERNSSLDRALTLSEHCVVTLSTSENICLTGLRSKFCIVHIMQITFAHNLFVNYLNRMVQGLQ